MVNDMKIITNTKLNGKLCYVQVKDILFLARYTNNKRLMQDYLNAINNGKTDNEFIKVSGDSYIRAFELCDYIIDFVEYSKRDIGVNYLSNMVKIKAYALPKEKRDQEGLDYQIDGVRDIISFKRGDLDYKIPLIANGLIEIKSADNKYVFNSTVIDGCFSLKTLDGSSLDDNNYREFLSNSINKMFDKMYPDNIEREYSSFVMGNTLVISVKKSEVKKKSFVNKILSKVRK